ncbi:MAG: Gfo/Idh/MocA family oxidoreductase [Streptosporangiaceae bacterium]|jgi:predicted dehydrogenase
MAGTGPVRWGIIGTARIARTAFLPGLRRAGGVAAAVAGRDQERAELFAQENGVERAIAGYQRLIDDPAVDALYIPLPNALHAEWTISALRAGKPVLCEKPLCVTLAETERVLAVAEETGTLLWEAFVFPFRDQFSRLTGLLAGGAIGELREIQSSFHFQLSRGDDIRLSSELGGGALNDVGCYPVRLALELFGAGFLSAWAAADFGGQDVDVETAGSLGFDGGRRLLLSCGLRRSYDTFTRLLGTTGQIHLTNPFHPGPADRLEVLAAGAEARSYQAAGDEPSFTAAIAHIQAVLRGEEAPRQLATQTSLALARALHDLHASMAAG